MKKYTLGMIFIMIVMLTIFIFIAINHEKRVAAYHALEKDIEESAMLYMNEDEEFRINLDSNSKIKISELLKRGYISKEDLVINKDSCSGYVIFTGKKEDLTPVAYIKCSDYTSLDY